jgi:hypothetical protein
MGIRDLLESDGDFDQDIPDLKGQVINCCFCYAENIVKGIWAE